MGKSWFPLLISLLLVTACGTGPTATQTTVPSEGTDTSPTTDTTYNYGGSDPTSGPGTDPYGSISPDPMGGSPYGTIDGMASAAAANYTLKGIVTDTLGAPLSGAKVSIGAQTVLTSAQGLFSIPKIADAQILVTVSMDGYQSVNNYAVNFSATNTVADKEFKLAPSGNTVGGNTGQPSTEAGGFTLNAAFRPVTFTSVSAMVVEGDTAYVLGVVKRFLLDRNSVCEINAKTGEEILTFSKTGLLSWLPKTADSLSLSDGQINVADGQSTWVFATNGALVKKIAGVRKPNPTSAVDASRGYTYTLKGGSKCVVKTASSEKTYDLPETSGARAIGLNTDGDLLVLDGTQRAVMQYTFTP